MDHAGKVWRPPRKVVYENIRFSFAKNVCAYYTMTDRQEKEVPTLKELRESIPGLNQAIVAVAIGVRAATLSDWENLKRVPKLDIEQWYALADLYKVSLEALRDTVAQQKKKIQEKQHGE